MIHHSTFAIVKTLFVDQQISASVQAGNANSTRALRYIGLQVYFEKQRQVTSECVRKIVCIQHALLECQIDITDKQRIFMTLPVDA